jgi:hypothetical protein
VRLKYGPPYVIKVSSHGRGVDSMP